ncbi:acyloxyacyl hydrolase [Sphingobacterium spiritivorum]
MKNFNLFTLVLLLVFMHGMCEAQSSLLWTTQDSIAPARRKNPLIIEIEAENGGIIASKDIKQVTFEDAYYNGVNLRVGWQTQRSKDIYHQLYNYPIYGVGLYSSTFNTNIIGSPYALYGFVIVPIHPKNDKRWTYEYRIALGLSGNFKPYNEETNPLNLVIGTKNNVFIDFGFRAKYKFHKNFDVGVGAAFHHFSNGAMRLPNKGVNLLPLTASLTYTPNSESADYSRAEVPPFEQTWLYHINLAGGFKQIDRQIDKRYHKATLSAYMSRHVSYKWRFGGGFDFFYSASGNAEEIAGSEKGKFSALFSGGPAFYMAHVLNERLVLNGNIGYYLHKNNFNGEIENFYVRAGARYYVYKNINAGVSIKAHMGKADYIEWTAGYTFGKKH